MVEGPTSEANGAAKNVKILDFEAVTPTFPLTWMESTCWISIFGRMKTGVAEVILPYGQFSHRDEF